MESPTRKMFAADPLPPVVPNRMREAILYTEDNAMPSQFPGELGLWLYNNRCKFSRGGDHMGVERFNYELDNVDNHAPQDLLAPFRKKLASVIGDKAILDQLCVPEFDLRHIEMHATLYQHGSHFVWHDDANGYDGEIVPSRRITFCYYMAATPKMFDGGELEFQDGTAVAPENNRLVLFHPLQQHRVRRVNCWSASFLHGRWALMGWIHGDAPEGYVDRIPSLRGIPVSG
jgi:Rps23 Pro-64 3,4-dihydroxylase Tpa1-like proline 4-hydroxylase